MNQDVILLLSALGVGAILREVVVAFLQRRKLGADAVVLINAAAADSVSWMRRELAAERAEHTAEIAENDAKVADLSDQLEACATQVQKLRAQLALATTDVEQLHARHARDQARIRELEASGR